MSVIPFIRVEWLVCSIAKHGYLPLAYRMDEQALVYYKPPYFVVRAHANMNDSNHFGSFTSAGVAFGYGVYEWKAKIKNPVPRTVIYPGGFEKTHGWGDGGSILIQVDEGTYKFITFDDDGKRDMTILSGEDWTTEKTFRVVWSATQVDLYIDGRLKASHSRRVPTEPMQFFAEVGTYINPAPTLEPYVFFRKESFEIKTDR